MAANEADLSTDTRLLRVDHWARAHHKVHASTLFFSVTIYTIHLLSYEDIAFPKAQFTPFSPLLKIKNSTLFNDLNNLEPMNKSFAQEAPLGRLFLLIGSHQAEWPLSRSQHWCPLIFWLLRECMQCKVFSQGQRWINRCHRLQNVHNQTWT